MHAQVTCHFSLSRDLSNWQMLLAGPAAPLCNFDCALICSTKCPCVTEIEQHYLIRSPPRLGKGPRQPLKQRMMNHSTV